MPMKKTYARRPRRYARKPTIRKAKSIVTKINKAKSRKNKDTFFFQARTIALLTPTQGVSVANYISTWVQLADPVNTFGVSQNAEFNLYRTMYDKVRINSMTVTITPKANTFDQALAQQDGTFNLSGQGVIHTVLDRDDQPPANIARITRYPSYRKYSVMKKFSRHYAIKYPTDVWLDCQNIYGDLTLLNRLGLTGGVYMYGENFTEDILEVVNEPWAEMEIRYNCVFQGKTVGNLTYDSQTGAVTITPTLASQRVPNTPVTVLYGSISNDQTTDASGNIVPVNDFSNPSYAIA